MFSEKPEPQYDPHRHPHNYYHLVQNSVKTVRTPFDAIQGGFDQSKVDQLYASKYEYERAQRKAKEEKRQEKIEAKIGAKKEDLYIVGDARRIRRFMDKLEP